MIVELGDFHSEVCKLCIGVQITAQLSPTSHRELAILHSEILSTGTCKATHTQINDVKLGFNGDHQMFHNVHA